MRIVERAELPPAKCAATGDIDGPFIDTGSWLPEVDPRIYLHVPFVEQMARDLLGMVPEKDVAELEEANEHLNDLVKELSAELAAFKTVKKALSKVG